MKTGFKCFVVVTVMVMAFAMMFTMAGCSKPAEEPQPEETEQEENAGVANPWTDVATAEEAAEGAGVETFECAGIETSLGTTEPQGYRWMEGMAEAEFPIAAVEMTIRKGTQAAADDAAKNGMGDISGDYNDYKYTWTQNVGDVTAQCSGNREGESTNTTWQSGDYYYSITAFGAGGDDDFGLSEKDVAALVGAIK
ncbi:MAG: hypothetical protein IKF07_04075 [Eubacterium sp.]|nr:hypothetical protein [Eubacterium sp.]